MRILFLLFVLADLAIVARYTLLAPPQRYAEPLPADVLSLERVEEVDVRQDPVTGQLSVSRPAAGASGSTDAGDPSDAERADSVGTTPASAAAEGSDEAAAQAGPVPETAGAVAEAEAQRVCRSVGPFTNVEESGRVAAVLGQAGYAPVQRVAEGRVWFGHWVYLAPFPTIQEAEEAAAALARNLVEDYYVVRDGDRARAISLGVFSNRAGAEARLKEMRDKGFAAEITDRYRAASVYWLDFMQDPERPVDLSALQAAVPGRIIRLERGGCELP